MTHSQSDLELAIRHVKETEALIAEQRTRIERLKSENKPTEKSEALLQTMQDTLGQMKSQLGLITDTVKGGNIPN